MRTRLIFVRHGESVHSVAGVVGGLRGCQGLTEVGQDQARRLAERLAEELAADGPVAVYSSVLRRAIETAAPIAAALDAPPFRTAGCAPGIHRPTPMACRPRDFKPTTP